MNTPPDPGDSRWNDLLARARKDQPAPVDLAALQRGVNLEARRLATARRTVAPDWTALLPFRSLVSSCLAGTCAFTLIASWQVWQWWQVLPWAQLLVASSGGDP